MYNLSLLTQVVSVGHTQGEQSGQLSWSSRVTRPANA